MVFIKTHKKNLRMTAIVWAACLLLFAAIYMLVIAPQNRNKKWFENELDEKKQTYEFAQNASREETQNRLLSQIDDLRDGLNAFVIDFDDSANLTFDISQIAREKEIASLNVEHKKKRSILKKTETENISENHIDISFTAGFNQFAAFLNALERHQPILFVNSFKLTRSGRNDLAYEVSMDVAALVKKPKEDKATAKSSQQISGEKI
ncbi:MAG: hypothetical protein JW715_17035 [Sedimentisphaerales bacterium]|nr:hypothetical protein [Sedimentisphaerales bacterium]